MIPGDFSFSQYLVADEKPLLIHSGPKKKFGTICQKIEKVLPVSKLRRIAFSHGWTDECGSLLNFLEAAAAGQR